MTAAESVAAKTGKPSASPFEQQRWARPPFDSPMKELPEAFRGIADNGIAHARDIYDRAKTAAEEANDVLQYTYTAAANGVTEYNLRLIEIARANTNAAFDHAHALLGVKSPSEFVEISTAQVRKQFEAMAEQTKELAALAQKATTDTAEPLTTGLARTFQKVALTTQFNDFGKKRTQ
jgi:phasin